MVPSPRPAKEVGFNSSRNVTHDMSARNFTQQSSTDIGSTYGIENDRYSSYAESFEVSVSPINHEPKETDVKPRARFRTQ